MLPLNQLTEAQLERLAVLAEECGEVIQAITKILRHGYDSHNPNTNLINREQLAHEIADLLFSLSLMDAAGDISLEAIQEDFESVIKRKMQYLHHQMGVNP